MTNETSEEKELPMTPAILNETSSVSAGQIDKALPEIARQVAGYWETTHHRAC